MFAFFEQRVRPTVVPEKSPPSGLLAFYWHFVRQTKGLYSALLATGLTVPLIATLTPVFIRRLANLMEAPERVAALEGAVPMLIGASSPGVTAGVPDEAGPALTGSTTCWPSTSFAARLTAAGAAARVGPPARSSASATREPPGSR